MSEREDEISREEIEETGENLTQQRIGEGEERPVDVSWRDEDLGETEAPPQEGEEGTDPVA